MNKSTRYLMVLVGTVALFALALSVVGPALAQTGTGSGSAQAGATVALQSGDTLGTLVDRYSLSGDNLRNFFLLNSDLKLENGQTVKYPVGVTVDVSGQGQVASGKTLTDAQLLEFVTLNRDLSFASDQPVVLPAGVPATSAENTPVATTAATATSEATSAATATSEATATQSATQENTYVTQEGDTLGKVMGFMGFQANVPVTGTTATASSAAGGVGAGTTATASQAAGGTGATATATEAATAAATPAAGGTEATATPAAGATATATPAAGGKASACASPYTTVAGDTLTAIAQRCGVTLEQLVAANPNLLSAGTSLNIPAASGNTSGGSTGSTGSIPQTGGNQSQVDLTGGGFTGLNLNLMPEDVARGEGVYVVRAGDSLESIARRFNTTVEWLYSHNQIANGNLIFRGQHMVVPQGEVIGVWNYQELERAFQAAQNKTESQTVSK